MCGLGQTAPNPVLSTLKYFRQEYVEHIENHQCPGGVCKELITYSVNDECTGCLVCIRACPEDAITGEKKKKHLIDEDKCIRCGACLSVCKFDAVDVY
jgi:ferredoxin